jgi:polar amino acid transport system substrate-binding protein
VPSRRRFAWSLIAVVVISTAPRAQTPSVLRWGGDAAGGAPYVEADPRNPTEHVGFDVEIAELVAHALGRKAEFMQVPFQQLDQAALRGSFDIGLSGVEDTPARRALLPTSIPYYLFREVLTVREADRDRYRTLADLRGHPIGTLTGTIAHDILTGAEATQGILPKWYDDDVAPYVDLAAGRVDAVLLDNVLAERSTHIVKGLYVQPGAIATSHYVIIVSPESPGLRDQVNEILRAAMRDGRLEAILRKWNVWNDDQPELFKELAAGSTGEASPKPEAKAGSEDSKGSRTEAASKFEMTRAQLPLLLIAAWRTLYLSCASMALAVILGMGIAIGRVYGNRVTRGVLLTYVEVMRGTPILLQLFIIYYGLPIKLDAYIAALLGLGLNYAAYESEIYRGALEAIPAGQLEAARVLGLTEWQILRLVRAPQALRLALAPMTNDFVAMLKDSSLVSVIAVTELEQQTQIFATDMRSWVIPGLLCAGLYLSMSLPVAHLARRLEAKWKSATL